MQCIGGAFPSPTGWCAHLSTRHAAQVQCMQLEVGLAEMMNCACQTRSPEQSTLQKLEYRLRRAVFGVTIHTAAIHEIHPHSE